MTDGNISEAELKKLTALTHIHQSIGASLELGEICRIVVRELIGLVKCDACAVIMIEDGLVKVIAERGFTQIFGEITSGKEMPAINHILQTGKPICSGDVLNSPAADCIPKGCSINSIICMPIVVNDAIKGIIHLDSSCKNAFGNGILVLVGLLCKEIAIAVERSILYSEIKDLSIRDELTGCFNRKKFDVDLAANIAYARKGMEPLSLLMLDIDWFKKYSDFHGRPRGDLLLVKIVEVFHKIIRPLDWLYRYGGDEFAVILTETNRTVAQSVARRLLKAVEGEIFEGEQRSQPDKNVTISIGGASFPTDAMDDIELLKAANEALYNAKNEGRNRVCMAHGS